MSLHTNERPSHRSEVKLQPYATNLRNSLSCRISLENASCREWEWVSCQKEMRNYECNAVDIHDLIYAYQRFRDENTITHVDVHVEENTFLSTLYFLF